MSRKSDSQLIANSYRNVDVALVNVGYLLRTTESGKFMWSAKHKTAISGLRAVIQMLGRDVPMYKGDKETVK